MFQHLQIYERRERALVGTADMALRVVGPVARALRRRASAPPRRVLVLRIERIGDLLMSLEAIADVVAAAPERRSRPRRRQLERSAGEGDPGHPSRRDAGRRLAGPRGCRGGHGGAAVTRAGLARAARTISRSTSSPISAATCSSRPPARPELSVSRAAAADRCWISRSRTTRGRTRAITAAGWPPRRSTSHLGARPHGSSYVPT